LWFPVPLDVFDAVLYGHQLTGFATYTIVDMFMVLLHWLTFWYYGPNAVQESGYAPFLLADVGLHFVRRLGEK
jgi:hypothetical protein